MKVEQTPVGNLPRPEYPRPQMVRGEWLCLNGPWAFEIDAGDSGFERGLLTRELSARITVPFCPESELSGVACRDFMPAVWYRRVVDVPGSWKGRQKVLHFGACDYETTVWVNGQEVLRHRGGFTPFSANLGDRAGETLTIVVRARDDHRNPQPRGKQSDRFANYGCLYVRTTGIWQTVWLEPVPVCAFKRPRITPDVANSTIRLELPLTSNQAGLHVRATLRDGAGIVATARAAADLDLAPRLDLLIPPSRRVLWGPGKPHLYDLELELLDGGQRVVDRVTSYAALRSVAIDGLAIKINGAPLFQRLVLDQGYYPDGILTAPTDAALVTDIQLAQEVGFNGARLHQKVFEERFLYHADRLGYLVWAEFPDWGCHGYGPSHDHIHPTPAFITEWLEALHRDYSHPCIIGWCGLNETLQTLHDRPTVLDDVTRGMFLAAKALDTTRPVLDASGYAHRVAETDVYDSHDYEQDPEKFAATHGPGAPELLVNKSYRDGTVISQPYAGQPYFVSEFGGIWWNPQARPGADSWGYGHRPKSLAEFYDRFTKLCTTLLQNPRMFGYCYTQLTDVYQEQNGLVTFARAHKFDAARLRAVQTQPAAIETASG